MKVMTCSQTFLTSQSTTSIPSFIIAADHVGHPLQLKWVTQEDASHQSSPMAGRLRSGRCHPRRRHHTECPTAGAKFLGGHATACARATGRPAGEAPLAAAVEGPMSPPGVSQNSHLKKIFHSSRSHNPPWPPSPPRRRGSHNARIHLV